MISISENFLRASADYLYLLQKAYPKKSIIKLVGDKYQLNSLERSMLFRGLTTSKDCHLRAKKHIKKLKPDTKLYIDGYNTIRTIGSYLTGKVVFIAMDGFLRDAAEMHRSILKGKVLDQVLNLLVEYLSNSEASESTIYLDEPISKSGELASNLNKRFMMDSQTGIAKTVHSPDYYLKEVNTGTICTADSAIIDHCQVKVFDLARAVLELNFNPDFLSFEEINT
jgi:hypothetical protein